MDELLVLEYSRLVGCRRGSGGPAQHGLDGREHGGVRLPRGRAGGPQAGVQDVPAVPPLLPPHILLRPLQGAPSQP